MDSKKIKILAIDDNKDNIITLKALINETFPEALIYTALNGLSGIELAESAEPDIILLDVVMPGLDGFEVCKKLKADKKLTEIPVVFVTSLKGDKESRIRALECGAEAFLAKPIDESELTAQIRVMLKIRTANIQKHYETERLEALVEERTCELKKELKDRKRVLGALSESEKLFKHVFESANVGKSITLPSGEITVNQAFCNMLGYSKEELKNFKWQDLTPPEDLHVTQKIFSDILNGSYDQARFNKHYIHKNGTKIWTDVSAALLRDQQGKPLHFITTIIDITDRKLAEDALKNRENLLNKIFDVLPIGLWFADEKGRLIRGNPAGMKIWGAQPTESIEKYDILRARNLSSGKEIEPENRLSGNPVNKGSMVEDEFLEIDTFDGQKKIIINYTASVLDDDGNLQGSIVVNQDITERKRAEKEILDQLDELRRWYEVTLDREGRVLELKREVNELLKQQGEALRYEN